MRRAIIVLVFVPLFALTGIEGRLFTPLGQAYIIAILASLVVSITLTPVMAYYMLPGLKRLDERESGLVRLLKRLYAGALDRAFDAWPRHRGADGVRRRDRGIAARCYLPRAFLPPFNEGTLNITPDVQSGGVAHRIGPRRARSRSGSCSKCRR